VRKARLGFIGAGWWATRQPHAAAGGADDVEMTAACRRRGVHRRALDLAVGRNLHRPSVRKKAPFTLI